MKRRSRAGGEQIKGRRRKTPEPKRRNAPKAAPRPNASHSEKETEVVRLARELNEALERQTATSEVLNVISGSSGELDPVFNAILQNAARICQAQFGILNLYDGTAYRTVALHNAPQNFARTKLGETFRPHLDSGLAYVARNKQVAQIDDIRTRQPYTEGDKTVVELADIAGARTLLIVPMLNKDKLVGTISIYRQEVRPFTDKQIELIKNFAAQAVIAIENARLLNEQREALDHQTATAKVLHVINSSPGDLKPVFEAMLESASRICEASFGSMLLREGERLHRVAIHNAPPGFVDFHQRTPVVDYTISKVITRIWTTKQLVHITDLLVEDPNDTLGKFADARTLLVVPLLKDNELVGIFGIYRQQVRPFTDKQIALVTNFASQAVIAIENARLLNELRQRTDDLTERTADLTEALEQQTATSEVLQVISGSPGDLEPVFATMLQQAVRICEASYGNLYRWDGDALHLTATYNTPRAFAEARRRSPLRLDPKLPLGRAIATKRVIHVADVATDEGYTEQRHPSIVASVELGGVRTVLFVPMLKEDKLIGVFSLFRREVRPFTDKQIDLVKNFAAQAVIAIENARLLNELRERTEEVEKLNQHLEQRVTDQVGEIERMSRLRRFLPPQVADLIVASGTEKQLESHRREITALFCDLRGFTGFSESADPEDVMTVLREYHEALGASIIKYSGTLERYAGDGVMVVFNDPVPVENPALQAVLMALEMREAIGALAETWRRWGHDIGFGIGIAHGFATLGTIGFEGRFDYAAIGTVSNVASRLCDEAKPEQILISPRVLMAVEDAVKVEPVGEFELKGIRRPLAAYNVLSAV